MRAWRTLARPAQRRTRRACPSRERQAGRRRARRGDSCRRARQLGRRQRRQGAGPAPGGAGHAGHEPHRICGVCALWRRRRDRSVELPGAHPDGVDHLRARGRQRSGVQAERVHAGHRQVAGRRVRRGGPRAAGAPADHRIRRHRRGAVPRGRRQAGVHRVDRHRQEGHGHLRRDADPDLDRMWRQGRPDRRRGRRSRRCRRRGGVGRHGQLGPDVRRRRAGLRRRTGLRRVRRAGHP